MYFVVTIIQLLLLDKYNILYFLCSAFCDFTKFSLILRNFQSIILNFTRKFLSLLNNMIVVFPVLLHCTTLIDH